MKISINQKSLLRRFATVTLLLGSLFELGMSSALAQNTAEVPGARQRKPIALVGGTIHPVNGDVIERGTIVFEEGVITAIGARVRVPDGAREVDISGRHVYPGLFESHCQLGLTEWAAVRATNDGSESGNINPNVEARSAVNPDSDLIAVTRANGVLLALSAPSGGLVSGRGSVLQLDGWTSDDLTLKGAAGLFVTWPRVTPPITLEGSAAPGRGRGRGGNAGGGGEGLDTLKQLFDDARAYIAAVDSGDSSQGIDLRLEAMRPVLDREIPLVAAADGLAEIESAVTFAVEQNVKLVIFGGYDAPQAAALLTKHEVPVIVSAVHRLPRRRHDAYDAAYTLPARLAEAGIEFSISGSDRAETYNTRNLAYHAGTAVAYGLSEEDAIRSITLAPARIYGVDDRVGSLEVGKDATLIITDGSPLETETNVEWAFVQGRSVQLTSRHTRLYEKYLEKYEQLEAEGE